MASLKTACHYDLAAASSSVSTSYSDYDVFINHRGPDVKNTFASHLYRRLRDHGLRVFLDKPELEEGQTIFGQIDHAIRVASVHIAIFSKNYAQSSWCLDELVLMKESGATILPVFLNVKPSVVRHTGKRGEFAEALQKHQEKTTFDPRTGERKRRYDSDTIQKWRNALSDVADISGFDLKAFNEDEGELLDKVLHKVLKTVPRAPLDVAKYPTGLGEKLQELEKAVLSQEERVKTEIVGIVGVGGVGKTTLAKEFFNCRRSWYNKSSFIFDVREKAARMSLNSVQSQLIKDLKGMDIKIESTAQGIGILKRHLSSCHALIVVDDVDSADQLDVILPIKHILSPQSLILVTSRDKHALISSGVLESSIYNLGGLNTEHSKELFCSYAFYHPLPPPEFEYLVSLFVKACDGLPLSLKVFGALVCGRNDRSYWEELLDQLHKTLPVEIQQRLRISYDKLHEQEQRLFLDIACYFIGEDRDLAIKLWGVVGLQNLEDKCLLEVDHGNKIKIIKMHDHIRDLGRNIAQDVSMPLRLWSYTTNTIDDWLEQSSSVITEVHGIKTINRAHRFSDSLITRSSSSEMSWYRRLSDDVFGNCLRHLFNNFGRGGILNLQLVTAEAGYLESIMRRARSPNLIWLRWYKCPCSCLPSWIPMENLKVLEIAGGQLEILWKPQSQTPLKLRELNIIAPLSAFPKSIGQLKHLEKIIIHRPHFHGIPLESLPEEFCNLLSLKYLELKGCEKMMSLPDSFGKLTTLEHIDLTSASSLQKLPDSFGHLSRLKHLSFCSCSNLTISNKALGNITTLEFLDLSSCEKVKELPSQVARQRHLGELLLEGTDLKELPGGIGDLCNLRVMTLGGDLFREDLLEELPPCLGHLKSLNDLSVTGSRKLTRLPDSFGPSSPLKKLKLWKCGIEYLPQDFALMKSLEILSVDKCPLLELPFRRVEGETGERQLDKLSSTDGNCMFGLRELWMSGTKVLEVGFPLGICPNLQTLTLNSCSELRQIRGFTGLGKLEFLDIIQCDKVKDLPSFEPLMSLKQLWVVGCDEMKSIEGLGKLTKLKEVRVRKCHEIQEISGVEHVMSLKKLYVAGCPKLKWVRGALEQLLLRLKQGFDVENKEGKDY